MQTLRYTGVTDGICVTSVIIHQTFWESYQAVLKIDHGALHIADPWSIGMVQHLNDTGAKIHSMDFTSCI